MEKTIITDMLGCIECPVCSSGFNGEVCNECGYEIK